MARQRRIIGDILEIDLGDGTHAYARVLPHAAYAFYDSRTKERIDVSGVTQLPVLFIVAVMNHAVTSGRWKRVGNLPLETSLQELPPTFIQDAIDPTRFSIFHEGKRRPATRRECEGLERMAAWDPTHVEDRLRDHYAGRKNKWVESLKIRG